jgi:hypothetical protein
VFAQEYYPGMQKQRVKKSVLKSEVEKYFKEWKLPAEQTEKEKERLLEIYEAILTSRGYEIYDP